MTPAKPLSGQVILITGASGGLGRAAALALGNAGATLVLIGRKIPRLENVYDEIIAAGGAQPAIYPLDLAGASEADYLEMANRIAEQLGDIHGVLHAAAELGALKPFGDIDGSHWQRLLHVNLTAPAFLTQALLPFLKETGSGRIVFIDDASTGDGKAFWGAYGIAKAGLRSLTKSLDAEMSNFGVNVVIYAPGPIRSAIRLRAYPGERPDLLDLPETKATELVQLFTDSPINNF